MCYFHIGDLVPESEGVMSKETYESYFKEKGTLNARYMRYLKSNLGKKNAFGKMMKLIDEMEFVGLQQAEERIDWETVIVAQL